MYKKILRCLREYKKDSILSPIFMLGEVSMQVLIPYIMATMIDNGVETGNMSVIERYGVLLVVLATIGMFFGVMSAKMASTASAGLARNLRHDMFYNVQNYSFSNIDKFSTASIVTRLTTDITSIQMAYMMTIRTAVRAPLMIIFSLIMVMTISVKLSLIYFIIIPLLATGLFLVIRYTHPIFWQVFRTYDKLNNVVQEDLLGIRVVKSFVREEHEKDKFGVISQSIYNLFSRAESRLAFNGPMMMTSMNTAIILVSWIGAKLIVQHTMGTGELMSIISYSMQMLGSLMMLSMVFVMLTMSRAAVERAVEVLDEESDIHNREDPVRKVENGSIEFKNVSFSYAKDPNKLCLSDVNFEIKSGETVGILGGTGSSKSSLVQLIPRLYDVTEGQILVGGIDVRDYDIETLRNSVSMVLQKNVLFSGTIKDNIRWGGEQASDEEIKRVCKLACADEFIREMPEEYDTFIDQGGTNVSGGQKQRLCIARALLKKPAILILDDSTSAVDTQTDAHIQQAFREEIPHTTKLIIAQRVSSVESADKIIIMDGGRIDAIGTHEELLKSNAIYQEVYKSQTKGVASDGASA